MAMDNRLVEWIKLQIPAGDDYVVISYDETDMFYAAMVTECRLASLIEPAVINTPDGIMTYRLTAIGEIALGIQDPATEPAATEPATVGTGDGERWYYEWDENVVRDRQSATRLYADGKKAKFDITAILNEYEGKLAAARERIAALAKYADGLAAENSALGIVISSVGIKVNDARDLLFAEKYAAADGELKNAQVIIQRNNKDALD